MIDHYEEAPREFQTLIKIRRAIETGSVKEYSIDEIIEMSGIMAEAAAAFYFSDTSRCYHYPGDLDDLHKIILEAAHLMVTGTLADAESEIYKDKLLEIFTGGYSEHPQGFWGEVEDAYINYYVRRLRRALGRKDEDDEDED